MRDIGIKTRQNDEYMKEALGRMYEFWGLSLAGNVFLVSRLIDKGSQYVWSPNSLFLITSAAYEIRTKFAKTKEGKKLKKLSTYAALCWTYIESKCAEKNGTRLPAKRLRRPESGVCDPFCQLLGLGREVPFSRPPLGVGTYPIPKEPSHHGPG